MKACWIFVFAFACVLMGRDARAAKKADKEAPPAPAAAPSEFTRLDLDQDGFLSETEFVSNGNTNSAAISPVDQMNRRKEFQKMDENRDRKVSLAEYDEANAPKVKSASKTAEKKGDHKKSGNFSRKARSLVKKFQSMQGK